MEQRHFCQASLKYVFLLQEVQECKKYEFVETVRKAHDLHLPVFCYLWALTIMMLMMIIFLFVLQLLGFMYSWLTFYHQGHEVATDYKPYMTDLQKRLQNVSYWWWRYFEWEYYAGRMQLAKCQMTWGIPGPVGNNILDGVLWIMIYWNLNGM